MAGTRAVRAGRPDNGLIALILAGGQGTRLRGLGGVLPKCLLPVFNQPLLLRQIQQCAEAGVKEVLVSIAAKFEPMVSTVLGHFDSPVNVTCVPEAIPLGPAGGLLSVLSTLGDSSVLMILGDEYIQDMSALKDVAQAHLLSRESIAVGTVAGSRPEQILCNVILDGDGRIKGLLEKPRPQEIVGDARWCGVAAFPANLLDSNVPSGIHAHVGEAINSLIQRGYAAQPVQIREIHLNLNTPDDALLASVIESCPSGIATTAEVVLARVRDLMRRALPTQDNPIKS